MCVFVASVYIFNYMCMSLCWYLYVSAHDMMSLGYCLLLSQAGYVFFLSDMLYYCIVG